MNALRRLRRLTGTSLERAAYYLAVFIYHIEARLFPLPNPIPVRAVGNVLFVGAHPDDESSCGGTLASHAALGDNVTILIVAMGDGSRAAGKTPNDAAARREAELNAAVKHLGAAKLVTLRQSDLSLDAGAIAEMLKPNIESADIVYTHGPVDFHPDHLAVAAAVAQVVRPGQTVSIAEFQCFLTPLLINRVHTLDTAAVAARAGAEDAHASQAGTLATFVRRRRLASDATRMGAAENFWEMDGAAYKRVMAEAAWRDHHASPFRGIRFRAFSDPLAILNGTRARLALRRAATPPPQDPS